MSCDIYVYKSYLTCHHLPLSTTLKHSEIIKETIAIQLRRTNYAGHIPIDLILLDVHVGPVQPEFKYAITPDKSFLCRPNRTLLFETDALTEFPLHRMI